MNKKINDKKTVADELLEGLKDFADALDVSGDLSDRFTCHRVVLNLQPEEYTGEKVRATRAALRVSQKLFAKFIGASVQTVRSWEQDLSRPSHVACRFMDEIRINPKHYYERLTSSIVQKEKKKKAHA